MLSLLSSYIGVKLCVSLFSVMFVVLRVIKLFVWFGWEGWFVCMKYLRERGRKSLGHVGSKGRKTNMTLGSKCLAENP